MSRSTVANYRRIMRRADAEDVAVALAVTAIGQIDVWAPNVFSTNLVGPRSLISACYLATGLALAGRRRVPFATFCFIAAVNAVQAAVIGASEGNGVLVPGTVAAYSVAANAGRRRALIALALLVPVIAVREVRNPQDVTVGDTADALAWYLLMVAAWLLGAYLRTRRLYVAELAARAARAEQDREARVAAAATNERARIAREMHDILAHSVSVMVVQAEAADEMLDLDPARARPPIQKIQQTGREALVDLRRTLGMLRAVDDDDRSPQPGIAALAPLVEEIAHAGLPVDVNVRGEPQQLPPGLDLSVYRIVQEALTNSLKHARAARASVLITYAAAGVELEIRDDGTAAGDADANAVGHGLVGMRERAAIYGGSVDAGPAADGGYVVRATLPLNGHR